MDIPRPLRYCSGARMTPSSPRLAGWILGGLALGLMAGAVVAGLGASQPALLDAARAVAVKGLDPVGRIFLHLLFMIVVPLVFSTLALGVVQLGRLDRLGPLAARTFGLFALNMAIGTALGLLAMNLVQPGAALAPETKAQLLAEFGGRAEQAVAAGGSPTLASFGALVDLFLPRNFLKALVEFQILPLILLALLTGAAGTQLAEARRHQLQTGLEILSELMIRIVGYAMWLAPVAVPCMVFSVIVKAGPQVVYALGGFIVLCLGVMALHLFGALSLLVKLLARRSPWEFFKAIRVVLITAFSTSSSNATLPTSLKVCRETLGLSTPVTGFVIPLGATMNMTGTALYEGCVVLFLAQIYGVPLDIGMQVALLLLAVLSAVAVAGIPGASLPVLAGLLMSFGVPAEGLALILGVDRLLDMARTTVNVTADVVTAVIVDRAAPPAPTQAGS